MTLLLIKLGAGFLLFGLVFGLACYRSEKIRIKPRFALPVVALVFALLNTGIYWVAKPVLNLATLGLLSIVMPLVLNGIFLLATSRLLRVLRIDVQIQGALTTLWLAVLLTVAHGALRVVVDMLVA
jgi:uncharacterized membrane protein YvlD (DUF360 family)